jgi:hypothetical protein
LALARREASDAGQSSIEHLGSGLACEACYILKKENPFLQIPIAADGKID